MAELINWFSNHTLIEIDRCSPLELLKLQENLKRTTERDGIRFVYGKGKQKTEIQKLYDELELCGSRLYFIMPGVFIPTPNSRKTSVFS